jgi:uncharacterized protein YecE (DUF72 family)
MAAGAAAFFVGTSGFSYKEWLGSFYPEKLPANEMLAHYARTFPTVEINQTFRGLPGKTAFERWLKSTPPGFRFALKAPQKITHTARLRSAGADVSRFTRAAGQLGERLGPLLFQLPPFMKRDAGLLGEFLEDLDRGLRVTFEFRHRSWFDDDVYAVMRRFGAALCIGETENIPDPPLVRTAPFLYLRLRRDTYDDAALEKWAARLREMARDGGDAFVYFRHAVAAPGYAMKLAALLSAPPK